MWIVPPLHCLSVPPIPYGLINEFVLSQPQSINYISRTKKGETRHVYLFLEMNLYKMIDIIWLICFNYRFILVLTTQIQLSNFILIYNYWIQYIFIVKAITRINVLPYFFMHFVLYMRVLAIIFQKAIPSEKSPGSLCVAHTWRSFFQMAANFKSICI